MQHLGVHNLVLVQGNMNNFLSGVPLKVEIFYSVGTHLKSKIKNSLSLSSTIAITTS